MILTCRYSVGLLDADVFGPSIPMMMNVSDVPESNHQKLIIPVNNYNIKCMSMGLLVDEESPVSYFYGIMNIIIIKCCCRTNSKI